MYSMFPIDYNLAKAEFDERLRQAKRYHLVQQALSSQLTAKPRWLDQLGGLLLYTLSGRYPWVNVASASAK